ncbi:PF09979 family protein [Leptospira interrogans serovar Pyrogenes str. 200701872]|uniref:PF09979 family protein n=1 Tax=Leptospira interrogans serovar Pyrogenes str. 200701872 TaxID=1193029 RepID=M7A5I4_LEPIR|nr:PF09979 family protein [Leptospira interrogans serovar Pyrogenes str. 200701872]
MYELRLDTGTFTLLERGHNFARYKGILSKPGVLDYPELNRKELIPEEELFHADTKRSFRGVPMVLTDRQNLHPGKIDSDNFREHIVGALGDNVREESGQLVAEFTIYDRETSRRIDSGELSQLSIARTMIPVEKNGSHEGKDYQVIQTNIRGNHVALTPRGRAGKDARVLQRTDSKEDKMAVVSYRADSDGKDHDIPSEVAKDIEVLKSKKRRTFSVRKRERRQDKRFGRENQNSFKRVRQRFKQRNRGSKTRTQSPRGIEPNRKTRSRRLEKESRRVTNSKTRRT